MGRKWRRRRRVGMKSRGCCCSECICVCCLKSFMTVIAGHEKPSCMHSKIIRCSTQTHHCDYNLCDFP